MDLTLAHDTSLKFVCNYFEIESWGKSYGSDTKTIRQTDQTKPKRSQNGGGGGGGGGGDGGGKKKKKKNQPFFHTVTLLVLNK